MWIDNYSEGFVKCPKCGKTYRVEEGDLGKEYLTYQCECGADISVDFFVYCSECKCVVGVDSGINTLGAIAKEFGRNFLKGVINPIAGVKAAVHLLDKKAPYDHGSGNCHFCKTKYARCPNCHSGVEVSPETKAEDTLFCTECGQKFRLQ